MSKLNKWRKQFWVDLGERAGSTFIEVLLPMWIAAETVVAIDWEHALLVAGSAAGLAILKGLAKNLKSDVASASLVNVTSDGEPKP